jgi:hypothetical protein
LGNILFKISVILILLSKWEFCILQVLSRRIEGLMMRMQNAIVGVDNCRYTVS